MYEVFFFFLFFSFGKKKWIIATAVRLLEATWSVYERVPVDDTRTINFLEGWHNRFASVGVAHPYIYKFIKSLKSEQARGEMIRRAALIGDDMTAPRRKCDAWWRIFGIFLSSLTNKLTMRLVQTYFCLIYSLHINT